MRIPTLFSRRSAVHLLAVILISTSESHRHAGVGLLLAPRRGACISDLRRRVLIPVVLVVAVGRRGRPGGAGRVGCLGRRGGSRRVR